MMKSICAKDRPTVELHNLCNRFGGNPTVTMQIDEAQGQAEIEIETEELEYGDEALSRLYYTVQKFGKSEVGRLNTEKSELEELKARCGFIED